VSNALTEFKLPFGHHVLQGDAYGKRCRAIVLHGAGKSSRHRFSRLRTFLNANGLPTVSFDFIGHGATGGRLGESSLHDRTDQASAVIDYACAEPLTLIGASMSGYTAIRLTETFAVDNLILLVPAVYTPEAYDLAFGPAFSAAIRSPGSWRNSDAFNILSAFRGNLLIVAAESDAVIPVEVTEKIYQSATTAKARRLHTVPGSRHRSLFLREQDFRRVMDMVIDMCRGSLYTSGILPDKPTGGATDRAPLQSQS